MIMKIYWSHLKLITNIIRRKIKVWKKRNYYYLSLKYCYHKCSGSIITTSTMSLINPSIGLVTTISTALLTSLAILITIEYISKLKIRFTKLRDW